MFLNLLLFLFSKMNLLEKLKNLIGRLNQRTPEEDPEGELQRIENVLARVQTIGSLERIYQNRQGYKSLSGQALETITAGSGVIEIDPLSALHTPTYLEDKLKRAEEDGLKVQAKYFSLTDPQHVNRYALYGISFHREKT